MKTIHTLTVLLLLLPTFAGAEETFRAKRSKLLGCRDAEGLAMIGEGEHCKSLTGDEKALALILQKHLADRMKEGQEMEKKHPGYAERPGDPATLAFRIKQQNDVVDQDFAALAKFCKDPKVETIFCMSEADKKHRLEGRDGEICFFRREGRIHNISSQPKKDSETMFQKHFDEWEAQNPKDCQKLLDKDLDTYGPFASEGSSAIDEDNELDINAESCEWTSDLPRKVISSPGCKSGKENLICTGYVTCKLKGKELKVLKLATCQATSCGAKDAVKCVGSAGFGTEKPQDEVNYGPSKKVKESGVIKQ